MRVVVQRVSSAWVRVNGEVVGAIKKGCLLLVGFTHDDDDKAMVWMARKIAGLRIFEDADGLMNLSSGDVDGKLLVVSQFTLYADVHKGRRPAFVKAAKPELAEQLYDRFCDQLKGLGISVEKGVFGAKMEVELVNDGPVTIIIEYPDS